jgi:hypothetical protein
MRATPEPVGTLHIQTIALMLGECISLGKKAGPASLSRWPLELKLTERRCKSGNGKCKGPEAALEELQKALGGGAKHQGLSVLWVGGDSKGLT